MDFRILGPLEVVHEGRALDLGRAKQRALLARLLLIPGKVVSADRLVDDLWDGFPPADAAGALQVQVSRLRQVLGADVVESRRPGYVLAIAPEAVDAVRFERLAGRGTAALAGGRPDVASATLEEALALWRGPALADYADRPFAMPEAARLEELRLAAAETWVEAELTLGRHAAVVADVRSLADAHPLRERLWGQLMLALYRSGRQAEALRAYGALRASLSDELGIPPSPALQRLEEAVLLQKPELDWQPPASAGPGPVPPRAFPVDLDDAGLPFVGRAAELAALLQARDRAEASGGGPCLVLLGGEPGVGKTRLALEVARAAHGDGATVLVGHCDEDLAAPYQPFAEAIGRAARRLPPADLRDALGGQGAELVRLVPELTELVPGLPPPLGSDPETERYRMFDAVGRFLAALARRAPVVLVLDDLHWATTPTLLLLRHLVARSEPMPVLVVGTYRDTEVGDRDPLAALVGEAGRLPNTTRVALRGLDEQAVHSLVGAVLGAGATAVARSIHEGTSGNALFVRELVRHMRESGTDPSPTFDAPQGVREVVRRRLARLSPATGALLTTAVVIGAEFDFAVLRGAVDLGEDEAVAALDEAVAAGLVAEVTAATPRYRFTHALVRSAIYDGLGAARRAQLHRRVGEAMERAFAAPGRIGDHLPELARHFARARALGGAAKAVEYATRAGDRALAQLAHQEAASHFAQALDVLDDVPGARAERRCDLLLSLGEAQRRGGDPAHRRTLLDAASLARELGDADRLATAALANTRSFWSATRRVDGERVATLEAALEVLRPGDSTLRACLLAKLAVERVYSGDAAAVRRLSDEALAMARRLGDLPTLARVLAPRYNTIRGDPGTLPERLDNTAELLAVADRLPDPSLRFEALGWRSVCLMEAAEPEAAAACFDAFDRLAAQLRQPTMLWYSAYCRASRELLAGRLDEAERSADEALHLGRAAGQPDAEMFHSVQRLHLAFERGELGRWERPLRIALGRDPDSWWFLRSWQALSACQRGDAEAARAVLAELAANGFDDLAFEPTWLHIVCNCAAVAAVVEDRAAASRLASLLAPYAGQLVTASSLAYGGAVDHYLGLLATALGHPDEADAHFAAAESTHRRMGAPLWLARTCDARARLPAAAAQE
ncbi:MAG: ATP-binding protein [Acidimicrobiia bacterium]